MSPDLRTPSRLGPSARDGFRKAGLAATLALALAAGVAGPAAAASTTAGPAVTTVITPGAPCKPNTEPGHAKPHHDRPGHTKPGHDKPSGHTKPGDAKPAAPKPGQAKPEDVKPSSPKPGQATPDSGKPGRQTKPGEAKPATHKPGEAKPNAGKPGDAKPAAHKPGQTKPGNAKPASAGKPRAVTPWAGDRECKDPKGDHAHGHGNGYGNGHGQTGPARPPGALGRPCSDIDALRPEAGVEYRSVLTGGRYYAGVRDITDNGDGTMLWTDLTGNEGYPTGGDSVGIPCGAALTGFADTDTVTFDVLTTTGRVYEITCTRETNDNDASILDCTDEVWTEVPLRLRPAALNSGVDPDA